MDLSGSWPYIEATARSRLARNKTKRHVYDYGEGIEIIGVAGEIIVRRFLGLPEEVHCGFDHGIDILYVGMGMDVKATVLTPNANHRFLQWPNWKKVRADYIIMTAVDPIGKIGTIIGYATRSEMIQAPVNYKRDTPCREILFTNLHPAWELVVEACRRQNSAAIGQFPVMETLKGNRVESSTRKRSSKPARETGSVSRD